MRVATAAASEASDSADRHAASLERELAWLAQILEARLEAHFAGTPLETLPAAPSNDPNTFYGGMIAHYGFSVSERIVLALALAPRLRPHLLDVFFTRNATFAREFSEFGGVRDTASRAFMPTVETALFVLAGEQLGPRIAAQSLFEEQHLFMRHELLALGETRPSDGPFSSSLQVTDELAELVCRGRAHKPRFGPEFPARELTTPLDWDDLVLAPETLDRIMEIKAWVDHGDTLLHELGLRRTLKHGFRSLFYGPPGTGKTLTAALLGKTTGRAVYRVDLSRVVSKYIGETEKNLERVFDTAERLGCILFFDEADALFGKRTSVGDAHDRYANQEVSYLLQRIEDFDGVVLLASNLKANLDDAFCRRLQSTVLFALPDEKQRRKLWQSAFSQHTELAPDLKLEQVASQYQLTGAGIANVVRYATLRAVARGTRMIRAEDVHQGVRRELQKEGRTL
jgi:hypothetical protein